MKKVAIIMGSDSDWPVVKAACTVLKDFGVPYEAHILSAHRTPEAAADVRQESARAEGYGVILCAAGMAAHLAGAFAANTTLPVVGIPMKGGALDGLDALLATVQMPSGFPGGHRGAERRQERRVPGRGHPGRGRRRPGRQAGQASAPTPPPRSPRRTPPSPPRPPRCKRAYPKGAKAARRAG